MQTKAMRHKKAAGVMLVVLHFRWKYYKRTDVLDARKFLERRLRNCSDQLRKEAAAWARFTVSKEELTKQIKEYRKIKRVA